MEPACTQYPANWRRECAVWIQEICVSFEPLVPVRVGRGGFLRAVRSASGPLALGLCLSFTLHCTRTPSTAPLSHRGSPAPAPLVAADAYEEQGVATWYGGAGDGFNGKPTASGEPMDPEALTCAHRTLPLGTYVEVVNLDNGKKIVAKVNDRGPFIHGRMLDLSKRGARDLGFLGIGSAKVRIRSVDPEDRPLALDPAEEAANPYTIQVAALSEPRHIEALRQELEKDFGHVSLQSATSAAGVPLTRVRVGSYASWTEAQKAADRIADLLKDRGVEPFITREH